MGSEPSSRFLVGLTGGIASGKTTVCDFFAEYQIKIIDADLIAREVVAVGSDGRAEIVDNFGPEILGADGSLDRNKLRNVVFADMSKRQTLESIVHPRVRLLMWERAQAAVSDYVILAIPLLVEGGLQHALDRTLVVDVSERTQRTRLAQRDGSSPEQIEQLLAAQLTREERLAAADDLIDNNGALENIGPQVELLHQRYLKLAFE